MRVEQLGEGDPEVAIVGSIHGDEPCGARAIERLLIRSPDVERPVKLVVANEEALERGVRYVDADLNRAFEGVDEDAHEHALAHRLADELAGCTVLSIHSTQSHPDPFGIVRAGAERTREIAQRLPIVALVEVENDEGRPFALEAAEMIEVEAGYQRSADATANAYRLAVAFLETMDVLPGEPEERDVPVFTLGEPVEKPRAKRYEVFAENFSRVEAGEAYAAADDEELVAERPFYPVLMSAEGYEDIFGYTGTESPVEGNGEAPLAGDGESSMEGEEGVVPVPDDDSSE